ncbi:Putative nucleotidyltransferase substrate binding domain-containing protein [Allopseudospirillum japonicum]|uniref:Nucleotidyltransferase substrate binding domain-containing protein n=1 Tax=Allopseudospirillum japonicum TaxID=64971 RepID=A0A1H6T2B9_9GAMM|nr:DUF294 nucleotidyltransferase-like domain-containing protein [Allopseudospirillum japonicum]SEI74208.1 Putative nucleotidyltransferase substrate binding domain-containing protein [Allopseudospirillum japonicum]
MHTKFEQLVSSVLAEVQTAPFGVIRVDRACALFTDFWRQAYQEALTTSLQHLQHQGWGPAPITPSILILGSIGRGEALLFPDQDQAVIYPQVADAHTELWLQAFSAHFTQTLVSLGLPECQGGVMSQYPLWRKSLPEWQYQWQLWSGRRIRHQAHLANILLDAYPLNAAAMPLWQTLEDTWCTQYAKSLLAQEQAQILREALPLIKTSCEQAPYPHALHVKRQAILPLQTYVRYMSYQAGIKIAPQAQMHTLARLQALIPVLGADTCEALSTAYIRFLQRWLVLNLQAYQQDYPVSPWFNLATLAPWEKQSFTQDLAVLETCIRTHC